MVYAIASWVYRWVVTFSILWMLADLLGPKLKILSQMLAILSLASLFIWLAAGRAVQPLRALARTTRTITETDVVSFAALTAACGLLAYVDKETKPCPSLA